MAHGSQMCWVMTALLIGQCAKNSQLLWILLSEMFHYSTFLLCSLHSTFLCPAAVNGNVDTVMYKYRDIFKQFVDSFAPVGFETTSVFGKETKGCNNVIDLKDFFGSLCRKMFKTWHLSWISLQWVWWNLHLIWKGIFSYEISCLFLPFNIRMYSLAQKQLD